MTTVDAVKKMMATFATIRKEIEKQFPAATEAEVYERTKTIMFRLYKINNITLAAFIGVASIQATAQQ